MAILKYMCGFFQILLIAISLNSSILLAIPIDSAYQLSRFARHLIIKPFPAVENFQSDLYEVFMEPYAYDLKPIAAVASFSSQCDSSIKGDITFMQMQPPTGPVLIQGNVTGLPFGKHGLHIHEAGDTRIGCAKLGEHFNPYFLPHGSPSSPIRHIGDLGNIEGKDDETTEFKLVDPLMSLVGPRSVVGRALVIKKEEDDLGRYNTIESMTTGSSGEPLTCAVISYMN